jgi:hypothetical protein
VRSNKEADGEPDRPDHHPIAAKKYASNARIPYLIPPSVLFLLLLPPRLLSPLPSFFEH